VEAGVSAIGVLGHRASASYENDAFAVKLDRCPGHMDPGQITRYDVGRDHTWTSDFVVGMSQSGPVVGKMMVKQENHYVFVEDQGEPGNSGTLMFAPVSDRAGDVVMVGTYYGLSNTVRANLICRGIVSPLPNHITDFKFTSDFQRSSPKVNLTLCDKRGTRSAKATRVQGGNGYRLADDGVTWFGVILQRGCLYSGWVCCGSTRSR
jgi:hypothetical protein